MADKHALKTSQDSRFNHAVLSHRGWVRSNNEDRLAVREFQTIEDGTNVLAAILCDGVGGHRGGEVAAQMGVEIVMQHIAETDSLQKPAQLLESAILSANQAILSRYQEDSELQGMATTCVAVLLFEDRLFLANLGDSRAYLLRKNYLFQLNYDHTWLEDSIGLEFGERSGITREHPLAHVLSRFLGSPQSPEVDLRIRSIADSTVNELENNSLTLQKGDRLLLCSDGVTDLLSDKEISEQMTCVSPRKDAQNLVLRALEKGGHDNASVIVIHI